MEESATQHSTACSQLIETGVTTKSPFSQIFMTLTQEEYVQFKWDANYWKGQYGSGLNLLLSVNISSKFDFID